MSHYESAYRMPKGSPRSRVEGAKGLLKKKKGSQSVTPLGLEVWVLVVALVSIRERFLDRTDEAVESHSRHRAIVGGTRWCSHRTR